MDSQHLSYTNTSDLTADERRDVRDELMRRWKSGEEVLIIHE